MTTRNLIAIAASQLPGRRALTILATALLAASFVSAGCNDNTNKDRGRRPGGSISTTIKCGNATCNTATQKCENGACVPKNGATTIPCGSTTCDATTQKCENGACMPKNGATTIPCGSATCDATFQECKNNACTLKPGFTQCGQDVCNDSTHSCDNSQCVSKSIECGSVACDAATQECRDSNCVMKGSTPAGCDPAYQKEVSGSCVTDNEGDGTCSSPCTGDNVCQGGQCVSVCSICTGSPKYAGCFSGQFPCEYDETSKKYMAVNNAYNPPQKMECSSPICGLKTVRDESSGRTLCYSKRYGECITGECIQLGVGGSYKCAKKQLPCGGTCPTGQQCNTTTDQCETSSHVAPTCVDSSVTRPSTVTPLAFVHDTDPHFSYRYTATVKSQDVPTYSRDVGSFEQTMNTCSNTDTTKTETRYKVFSFTLEKYANILFYAKRDDGTDSAVNRPVLSLAIFNADKCSASLFCRGTVSPSVSTPTYPLGTDNGHKEALPPGNYYVIVKDANLNTNGSSKYDWTLSVVKEEYEQVGGCTEPTDRIKCLSGNGSYGRCILSAAEHSIYSYEYTCLTSTGTDQATKYGCFYKTPSSSSDPSCYGLTYDNPVVIDGSSAKTFGFELPPSERGRSAYKILTSDQHSQSNRVDFTDSSCNTTITNDKIKSNYILKVENLKPNATVSIDVPSIDILKKLSSSALENESVAVRIQKGSTYGAGAQCVFNKTMNGSELASNPESPFRFSYTANNSSTETLYITLSTTEFSSSYGPGGKELIGFSLTIK